MDPRGRVVSTSSFYLSKDPLRSCNGGVDIIARTTIGLIATLRVAWNVTLSQLSYDPTRSR